MDTSFDEESNIEFKETAIEEEYSEKKEEGSSESYQGKEESDRNLGYNIKFGKTEKEAVLHRESKSRLKYSLFILNFIFCYAQ